MWKSCSFLVVTFFFSFDVVISLQFWIVLSMNDLNRVYNFQTKHSTLFMCVTTTERRTVKRWRSHSFVCSVYRQFKQNKPWTLKKLNECFEIKLESRFFASRYNQCLDCRFLSSILKVLWFSFCSIQCVYNALYINKYITMWVADITLIITVEIAYMNLKIFLIKFESLKKVFFCFYCYSFCWVFFFEHFNKN